MFRKPKAGSIASKRFLLSSYVKDGASNVRFQVALMYGYEEAGGICNPAVVQAVLKM